MRAASEDGFCPHPSPLPEGEGTENRQPAATAGGRPCPCLSARTHFHAFREVIGLLTRHRQLTWEMTRREISDRYAGQVLGAFWAIGHPLALMGIYLFIFGCVFRMKIGGTRGDCRWITPSISSPG